MDYERMSLRLVAFVGLPRTIVRWSRHYRLDRLYRKRVGFGVRSLPEVLVSLFPSVQIGREGTGQVFHSRHALAVSVAVYFSLFAGSTTLFAGPVFIWAGHPDGPHAYQLFEAALPIPPVSADQWDWDNARTLAEQESFLGASGYLATITSAQEQQFIQDHVLSLRGDEEIDNVWLGGWEPSDDGVWEWITGEPWGYTNWDSGEPDDLLGEDYLMLYQWISVFGQWNDARLADVTHPRHFSYLVEFSVPEPATLCLLGLGGLLLLRRRNPAKP